MSRIQLPGSLHQHITPTLIYLRLHHTSPKKKIIKKNILSNTCPTSSIHTNRPRFPDATILRKGSPTPIATLLRTLAPVLLLPLYRTLSHQSSTTPHLGTALKTPKIVPLWPPAIWYYYCLLCLVVFVYLERFYINPGYFYFYVQSFLLVKKMLQNRRTHLKKNEFDFKLMSAHPLFVQNTVFYMFALTAPVTATITSKTSSQFRTKWQIHPSGCKQWSSPKPHVGQSVIMEAVAADASIRFSSWLVRNTVGVFRKEREGKKRERVGVGGGRMLPLSPACQLTWWMNQFRINLMLNSYNWIIYTAQRHMGSDHFNPRWAPDFCSQAIGLWPTVNNLMLRWLSPANQLTPVTPQCCRWFVQGCV